MPARKGESTDAYFSRRMHDFKEGEMHSGTGEKGRKQKKSVGKKAQALAIILSELRKGGRKV